MKGVNTPPETIVKIKAMLDEQARIKAMIRGQDAIAEACGVCKDVVHRIATGKLRQPANVRGVGIGNQNARKPPPAPKPRCNPAARFCNPHDMRVGR